MSETNGVLAILKEVTMGSTPAATRQGHPRVAEGRPAGQFRHHLADRRDVQVAMGGAGYRWMMGDAAAPAWMRGHAIPTYMMGTAHDPGKVMGALWANGPGLRVSPVPLEYSIEWLTCAIASGLDVVMVGLPSAAQDRLPAHVPGTRPSRRGVPRRPGEEC
jgi:hypothetical protein